MDLRAAIAEFVLDRESFGRARATIRFYRTHLGAVADFMERQGLRDLQDLNRSTIRLLFAQLVDAKMSEHTRAAYDRAIRAFCRFCRDEGWLERDPMKGRPRVKPAEKLPETWSPSEVARLLATCNGTALGMRDRAIMLLLLDTGMRAGELVRLPPHAVTFDDKGGGLVRIEAAWSKSTHDRAVPISPEAASALRQWLAICPAEAEAVFVSSDGHGQLRLEPLTHSGLGQMIKRRCEAAGVKPKARLCHIWRHTFARYYVLNGGDLESLRRMLGHQSLDTVRIYLGFSTEDLEEKHRQHSPLQRVTKAITG